METMKRIFTMSDFDCDCPNLDLFKFHPQLRIFLVSNGIFFNNHNSYIRFVWPVLSGMLSLVGTSLELMFMYHGLDVQDYSFATECFIYFVIVTVVPIVYTSVILNKGKLVDLLNKMNRDFIYICRLGPRYRNTFLEGQLLIWQLCITWFSLVTAVSFSYFAATIGILMYQSLFATRSENTIRPLIFPFWLPEDDPYRTPNYEIFMILEIVIIFIVLQTFCVFVYILFHVLLHNFYVMNMIMFDCEVLFVGLDESVVKLSKYAPRRIEVYSILNSRMRRIVKWHNLVFESVQAVSSIYGLPLVYQVMFSAIPISLTAYQIAESLDHGKFDILFAMLGIVVCVQLWIPCYLGTIIRDKAYSVGDAIWNSGWHLTPLGRLVRRDVAMVIMRAQRPLSIKFRGLANLDLETFSSIMSTSYTYFNVLRQYTSKG